VDKALLDLEAASKLFSAFVITLTISALDATLASRRARFDQVLSVVFYAVTSGSLWGIVWWYRRLPVIWIPAGWMPGSVASLLSIGGAPKGILQDQPILGSLLTLV
jgi:hypothetical protein